MARLSIVFAKSCTGWPGPRQSPRPSLPPILLHGAQVSLPVPWVSAAPCPHSGISASTTWLRLK